MRTTRTLTALSLAAAIGFAPAAFAAPEKYEVDPTHSFVEFSISHMGFSMLKGRFNEMSGNFVVDADKPATNAITMEVKTPSIDSNHAERDKHLRSGDYLNVKKHGVATFKTTSFEPKGQDGVLKGDLTLFGVTKPISVDVQFVGAGDDPWGGYRRGYAGTTTIKPADFGAKWNLGPAAETVKLEFNIEGVRK